MIKIIARVAREGKKRRIVTEEEEEGAKVTEFGRYENESLIAPGCALPKLG